MGITVATSVFPKKALGLVVMRGRSRIFKIARNAIFGNIDSVRPSAVQIALQKVARSSFESVGHKALDCDWLFRRDSAMSGLARRDCGR